MKLVCKSTNFCWYVYCVQNGSDNPKDIHFHAKLLATFKRRKHARKFAKR